MKKALKPLQSRVALIALAAILTLAAFGSATASAITVNLRVEGASATQFSGPVTTNARTVPGGTDTPACRADSTAPVFASPNSFTAVADALGDANIATSGGFYGWGTLLCGINGEFPADTLGGWLVRINQQDSTAPNGYVTAADPLTDGANVLVFLSPSYGHFSSSLELRLPATAKPGVPVSGFVDSFDTSTDVKSAASGASVSGPGSSATAGDDGSFTMTFPSAGRFLVNATSKGAVRGSQWVTVAADAPAVPVAPVTQKEINQKRRSVARANCRESIPSKQGDEYVECVRTANQLGRTVSKKEKRIAARLRCRINYPQPSSSRVRCMRDANSIGKK
ncbi:MAG: hypothetical protein JHD02_02655 [Thermoleophilaceae bacterium]|nr:hypothetical protein [Thermoleophilaceae bacterium]